MQFATNRFLGNIGAPLRSVEEERADFDDEEEQEQEEQDAPTSGRKVNCAFTHDIESGSAGDEDSV